MWVKPATREKRMKKIPKFLGFFMYLIYNLPFNVTQGKCVHGIAKMLLNGFVNAVRWSAKYPLNVDQFTIS